MNANRLLIGTITGFIGYFMSGGLFYTVVFKDMLASTNPGMANVQVAPDMAAIALGNLIAALLLAYIFEKWAGVRTISGGLLNGAIIGFLISFGYDCMVLGTTSLMTWAGVFTDVLVYTLCSAVAGAFTAFGLSFKRV